MGNEIGILDMYYKGHISRKEKDRLLRQKRKRDLEMRGRVAALRAEKERERINLALAEGAELTLPRAQGEPDWVKAWRVVQALPDYSFLVQPIPDCPGGEHWAKWSSPILCQSGPGWTWDRLVREAERFQ